MIRILALLILFSAALPAARVTKSLDGTWDIAESISPSDVPAVFSHKVPVPGLANLATPPFPDVDQFDSRELINNKIRKKLMPESARTTAVGVPRQARNYFWYRTTFRAPERGKTAILRIDKAQFGTSVRVNGKPAGEHMGCFTAGVFDIGGAVRWNDENELIVRVGAHPAAMPASVPAGTDFEKLKWTPGIYDSVHVYFTDSIVIESIQVAPRVTTSEILVQTGLKNHGTAPVSVVLQHRVREWKTNEAAGALRPERLTLRGGESRTVTHTIPMPKAKLWTPETPFLYVVESTAGGDSTETRFGMREIRFDTPARRAYLNGKPYFLRGSNITLHRFFEDPKAGALVWDEAWVRKLLIDIPKKMHWNSFRFCIGPVPQKWLDIADEAGLLIQYEYFIWTGRNEWHAEWTEQELIREYTEWMRDNWNHPSIALWDSNNETIAEILGERIIPAVRDLDLSNRAWENGYNVPSGPDDPYEDHPYLFSGVQPPHKPGFHVADLEQVNHARSPNSAHPTGHAAIVNEYGWLWLNRDGSPTLLTDNVYRNLLGPDATNEQRLKLWAYLLGGLTEMWRATRDYAGVLHFVYLTCSFPGVFTSDHWRDLEKLELDPDFADYAGDAFKPLGVYLNFWQPEVRAGSERKFAVSVVNDESDVASGALSVSVSGTGGKEYGRVERKFQVAPAGQQTYVLPLKMPDTPGEYTIRAVAHRAGGQTISRRNTKVVQ